MLHIADDEYKIKAVQIGDFKKLITYLKISAGRSISSTRTRNVANIGYVGAGIYSKYQK